jgi:polysaccharide biosynthesis/export protein
MLLSYLRHQVIAAGAIATTIGVALPTFAQTPLPPSGGAALLPNLTPAKVTGGSAPMPAPMATAPLPVTAPVAPANYLIGPGDNVQVAVYGYEEYNKSLMVMSDGTITLPIIGSVMASGQTAEQLAKALSSKLETYLVNPVVTVTLSSLRPITVNIAGEVQRPGPVQLRGVTTAVLANNGTPTSPDQAPTVSTALLQAGGVTRNADVRQVVLKRYRANGASTATTINLWDVLTSENGFNNETLQDGDTLYVPKLAANATLDRRLLTRSSLAPSTVRVRVVGEVKLPGQVQVPPDSTISSAVAIAGGPTDKAKMREVTLVRMNDAGQVQKQTLDLTNLVDVIQVQEGDVVMIPKAGGHKFLDLAAPILGPFGALLNLFR